MTPTHEQVLTAIDEAQTALGIQVRAGHCDDLRATAELHAPVEYRVASTVGLRCRQHPKTFESWPCADYQQVIARLQSWGYLTERTDDD